jgi:hypothetical protein
VHVELHTVMRAFFSPIARSLDMLSSLIAWQLSEAAPAHLQHARTG